MFLDLTKTLTLAFWQALFMRGLSNFAWLSPSSVKGLAIHSSFNDHISRLKYVRITKRFKKKEKKKRFLSTVVQWCKSTTHIKKIKHRVHCVTGMHFKDTANTVSVILHLCVTFLSICSSCVGMFCFTCTPMHKGLYQYF